MHWNHLLRQKFIRTVNLRLLLLLLFSAVLILWLLADGPIRQSWYRYLNQYSIEYYRDSMVEFNARRQANLPAGHVIVYGDSLVQGLALQVLDTPTANYGVGHATLATTLEQISRHRQLAQARTLIFATGINDILQDNSESVLPGYLAVLDAVPNDVPILISLVLPVNEQALSRPGVNSQVAMINDQLIALCNDLPNVGCVDPGSRLLALDGQLADEYHIGDGLHLTPLGNSIWLDVLNDSIRMER